jgi:hypothetical protein
MPLPAAVEEAVLAPKATVVLPAVAEPETVSAIEPPPTEEAVISSIESTGLTEPVEPLLLPAAVEVEFDSLTESVPEMLEAPAALSFETDGLAQEFPEDRSVAPVLELVASAAFTAARESRDRALFERMSDAVAGVDEIQAAELVGLEDEAGAYDDRI